MKTNKFYYWLLTISAVVLLFNSTQLSAQTCTPPPAGMVAWLPGDGNAQDIQNNAQDLSVNGGVTFPAGKVAQAFNFDGTGDVTYSNINAGSTYTVDFWVRPTRAGGFEHLVSNDFRSQNYGSLYFVNDRISYFQGGNIQRVASAPGSVPLNAYTHVALTYDGAVNRLYLNGNLVSTSGVHTETFNNRVRLGFAIVEDSNRFIGQIDEVEIFNRRLSQTEIQAIVNADTAGKCTTNRCSTITFSPSSLPNGMINMPYNQTITASGGTGPYTFSVTGGGSLPPGLTLNPTTGQISGTPSQGGTFNFNIAATDSNNFCTGSQAYSLTIAAGPTTATVSVGGRITTSSGFGISQARVSITDAKGETRTVFTNQSGYYRFDETEAGQTYIVSVSRKRYQFMPSTQVVSVNEDLDSIDFMALPLQRMKQR